MGSLINYLTFGGVKSSDYGVFISGEGTYNAPERRGEFIAIPARNGALFIDDGAFENIEVEYPAFIGSPYDGVFNDKIQTIRIKYKAKTSYTRLTDTYHPDEFRMALYKEGFEAEPHTLNRSGDFTLVFTCKPQRFLMSGEATVVFTSNGNIANPTEFAALPLIKVTGHGLIKIGSYEVYVSDEVTEPFWIDSEIMEVYIPPAEVYAWTDEQNQVMTDEHLFDIEFADGAVSPTNMIEYVTFKDHLFPKIESGTVPIEFSNTITKLEIIPRWWRI